MGTLTYQESLDLMAVAAGWPEGTPPVCQNCVFHRKRLVPEFAGSKDTAYVVVCRRYPTEQPTTRFHWCGEHRYRENTEHFKGP
jgi:hypothetical protein